jgi:hypothetical protein
MKLSGHLIDLNAPGSSASNGLQRKLLSDATAGSSDKKNLTYAKSRDFESDKMHSSAKYARRCNGEISSSVESIKSAIFRDEMI